MYFSDACSPIVSLHELLSNRHDKLRWCDLVQTLVARASPRQPSANFYSMDSGPVVLNEELQNRPQVLVCHDYKGNYLEDKWINGGLSWEEYRFYNWSVVDIFCYFSHYFITLPTLQYLNAAHLNGVKVIGTVIVEGVDGIRTLNEVLKSREQVEIVANSLVEICKRLKFEGWLLNIEVAVDADKVPILKHFVKYLTEKTHAEIPHGTIIWYDSVISPGGALSWQNELNAYNK
jgi:mannosyl-glycoprotein endo-beta-N-acetylglucosaminidase